MLVRKFSTGGLSPKKDDAPSYTEVMLKVRGVWFDVVLMREFEDKGKKDYVICFILYLYINIF